ncbi:hypothetical protein J6590_023605 [Homalodisca vitripennis]|nr:hypothetical protein J6590_023605 [Homalodisca vitripennis]
MSKVNADACAVSMSPLFVYKRVSHRSKTNHPLSLVCLLGSLHSPVPDTHPHTHNSQIYHGPGENLRPCPNTIDPGAASSDQFSHHSRKLCYTAA